MAVIKTVEKKLMQSMEIFTLAIDNKHFQSTNGTWNDLSLNDPWSVGYVSNLIEEKQFKTKEDWEQYYYDSGRARLQQLAAVSDNDRRCLNDFLLKKNHPERIKTMHNNLCVLNTRYGRTKEELLKKANILYEKFKPDLSLDDCFECVRFRTICETWNGIIIRERNTIKTLQKKFPKIVFSTVTGEVDYQYGVDYELYLGGKLLGAIQIKPKSYFGNTAYTRKAQRSNSRKFEAYKNMFGQNVRVVVANMRGQILNNDNFLASLKHYYSIHT